MTRIVALLFLLILGSPLQTVAGTKEDVAAATHAWIDAQNSRDIERVVVLYDPDAVLWGTASPTIRDSPSAIRDYFQRLPTFPAEYKAVIGEQRVRIGMLARPVWRPSAALRSPARQPEPAGAPVLPTNA